MLEIEKAFNEFMYTLQKEAGNNKDILELEDYQAFFSNATTLKAAFNNTYDPFINGVFIEYKDKLLRLNGLQNFQTSLRLFESYHDLAKQ